MHKSKKNFLTFKESIAGTRKKKFQLNVIRRNLYIPLKMNLHILQPEQHYPVIRTHLSFLEAKRVCNEYKKSDISCHFHILSRFKNFSI